MDLRSMTNQIIENGSTDDMHKLHEILIKSMMIVKRSDEDAFKWLCKEIHLVSFGDNLTEHEARKWVCKMENEDGSKGQHWSVEQTESINTHKFHKWNWYVVMNMMYSDYYCSHWSEKDYIHLANKFLLDKDSPDNRLITMYYDR